jgi:hypothetical protein
MHGVVEVLHFGLQISDFGLKKQIANQEFILRSTIRIPHSQTGAPPEGWESEGQIRNSNYPYSLNGSP